MVILSNRITQNEIEKRLKELRELLQDISYEELWGVRPFAYPIKGQDQGYYAVWNFMMDTDGVKGMEKTLQLFPDLVRYLILQVPEDYKPITLKEIEAGLEDLKKQKAEKRGGMRSGGMKKKEEEKPAPEKKKVEAAPAPEKTAVEPEAKPAAEAAEDAPKKAGKSFDQKLEDILSNDDLGL